MGVHGRPKLKKKHLIVTECIYSEQNYNHSVTLDAIHDTWPPLTRVPQYSDSAIINTLQDNHLMIHDVICLTEVYEVLDRARPLMCKYTHCHYADWILSPLSCSRILYFT